MLYLLCGYVAAYQMYLKHCFQKGEEWYLIHLHPFAMGNIPAFKFGWEIFMSVYMLSFLPQNYDLSFEMSYSWKEKFRSPYFLAWCDVFENESSYGPYIIFGRFGCIEVHLNWD